jgi:hypothetical protein
VISHHGKIHMVTTIAELEIQTQCLLKQWFMNVITYMHGGRKYKSTLDGTKHFVSEILCSTKVHRCHMSAYAYAHRNPPALCKTNLDSVKSSAMQAERQKQSSRMLTNCTLHQSDTPEDKGNV